LKKRVKLKARYDGSSQRIGDFAEYLVACDLISKGYRIHMASPGSFYDIILDDNGRLYRIQVKGSLKPKKLNCYKFNNRAKKVANYDLVAYVAIDQKKIAYEVARLVGERHISIDRFESMTLKLAIETLDRQTFEITEHGEIDQTEV